VGRTDYSVIMGRQVLIAEVVKQFNDNGLEIRKGLQQDFIYLLQELHNVGRWYDFEIYTARPISSRLEQT